MLDIARSDIGKPDKGKPDNNKLKKDREGQGLVIDLCMICFQKHITDSTTIGSVFLSSQSFLFYLCNKYQIRLSYDEDRFTYRHHGPRRLLPR